MIFDTHSHCYWESLLPDIEKYIELMRSTKVTQSVQIGCDIHSSHQAIDLSHRYPDIFHASVGYHPENCQDDTDFSKMLEFEKMLESNHDRIVAIGETGLDYHYLSPDLEIAEAQRARQKQWWIAQHDLSVRHSLPLIIHTRDARDDTLDFMMENDISYAVMHCFSEDIDFANRLIDFSEDIYFSFSGIVTYKNAKNIQEVAKLLPIDRILVETDAPFLAPVPVRWTVNHPANTRYVLEKIAELRGVKTEEIEEVIYVNSLRFYQLESILIP